MIWTHPDPWKRANPIIQINIFNFGWSFDIFEKEEIKNAAHKNRNIENDCCHSHNDSFCSLWKLKEEIFLWPAIGWCAWNEVCKDWYNNKKEWCKNSWQGNFLQLPNVRPSWVDPFCLWDLFENKRLLLLSAANGQNLVISRVAVLVNPCLKSDHNCLFIFSLQTNVAFVEREVIWKANNSIY